MGFFSGLTGGQKTNIPATGYYSLPSLYRGQYDSIAERLPGATSYDAFTPPEFNADQLSAFDTVRGMANMGPADIMNLVQKYQNPYDQSVIDGINREAVGNYSQVKQGLNEAGQMGSNRSLLGANDVDLSRLQQIGQFKQSQFNNSLNTGLVQNQQNIGNLLGIGGMQQERDWNVQQAPFNALNAQFSILNPMAQFVGNSSPQQTIKTGGGLGGLLGAASGLSSIASGFGGLGSFGLSDLSGVGGGFFGTGIGGSVLGNSGNIFNPVGPFRG